MSQTKETIGQYQEINSLQGVSLFSATDYKIYYDKSQKAKKRIKELIGGQNRLYFKVDSTEANKIQLDREFKSALRAEYKNRFGFDSGFFQLARMMQNSKSVVGNRHNSGKKLTKVINSDPLLGPDVVLMYSQIKNEFTTPESYLIISIDPYDFVTMGVGQGWATCYKPLGEHYSGSFSVGLDNYTFLTYIVTKNPDTQEYIKVPLKKIYRRLGVFSKEYDGVVLSTQYPYKNNGFEEFTLNTLEGLFFNDGPEVERKHSSDIKVYKTRMSQIYNDFTLAPSNKKENLYLGYKKEKEILSYGTAMNCISCHKGLASCYLPICTQCEDDLLEDADWGMFK